MRESPPVVPAAEMARQQALARAVRALPGRPQTYHIVTFGCQMNAHDSEKLSGMLEDMGLAPAARKEDAGFILYNTCCVRDNAERKALGNVTWLKELKKENPALLIGVCGCMIQQRGMAGRILRQYPFVDLAFGTHNLHCLPEYLHELLTSGQRVVRVLEDGETLAEDVPVRRASPYTAYITVMYGCDNFCSYCIVPYVRGRERSRASDAVVREAEGLAAAGVSEIMLLGQNVNSYGLDRAGERSFAQLLRRLEGTGIPRIRFMTSHPKDLSDELIEEMARNRAVCPHLHLPVQSGSDRILSAMNRRYTRAAYLDKVRKLRQAVPGIGLTTDLIVGFPGETDADFEDTMALVRAVRYDSAFTFIFSPRAGTAAEKLPGRLDPALATERIERLIAVQEGVTAQVLASMAGQTVSVLCDGHARRDARQLTGKCGRNISVNFPGEPSDLGRIVPVRITGHGANTLRGERVP